MISLKTLYFFYQIFHFSLLRSLTNDWKVDFREQSLRNDTILVREVEKSWTLVLPRSPPLEFPPLLIFLEICQIITWSEVFPLNSVDCPICNICAFPSPLTFLPLPRAHSLYSRSRVSCSFLIADSYQIKWEPVFSLVPYLILLVNSRQSAGCTCFLSSLLPPSLFIPPHLQGFVIQPALWPHPSLF